MRGDSKFIADPFSPFPCHDISVIPAESFPFVQSI